MSGDEMDADTRYDVDDVGEDGAELNQFLSEVRVRRLGA